MAQPARFLIVDDDGFTLKILESYIQELGHECRTALDAVSAMEILDSGFLPEAILTDAIMPEIDGFELIRLIRGQSRFSHIPIVMITSSSDPAALATAFEAGADDFIAKPVEFPALKARVNNLLKAK
jgi:PleD family two-component response regulator